MSDGVFKLTAQLMPIGTSEPHTARLDRFSPLGFWIPGPTAIARRRFRYRAIPGDELGFDRAWQYRVVYTDSLRVTTEYDGQVPVEPSPSAPLTIGVVNCTIHSFRPLDMPSAPQSPLQRQLGLYTSNNLYFPYTG